MLKVDLHLHTAEDPVDHIVHDAAALIDRAADLRFDAIAITLHERQLTDRALFDRARERGLVLIPGIERTIQGRHVLLLNFPQSVEQVRSFADIAALKAKSQGLVIAPHPFYPSRTCLGALLETHRDLFDAVEWSFFWNGAVNFNQRALRWAEAHDKPLVGNSDLHDLRQLGRTHSWVAAERDATEICAAIRLRRVSLQTEPVPFVDLFRIFGSMILRGRKTAQAEVAAPVGTAAVSSLSRESA